MFSRVPIKKFKELLKKHLYNSSDSNFKLSLTVSLGIFISVIPAWGLQNTIALAAAFIFRLNKVIIFGACNISQPPLTPVIIFLSYLMGSVVYGSSTNISYSSGFTTETVKAYFMQYFIGSIILAFILAVISGFICYTLLGLFRKNPAAAPAGEEQL